MLIVTVLWVPFIEDNIKHPCYRTIFDLQQQQQAVILEEQVDNLGSAAQYRPHED